MRTGNDTFDDVTACHAPARRSRSWRPFALAVVIAGHVLALVAAFFLPGWLALVILAPAAFCVIWGTFYPHSRLFGPVVRRWPVAGKPVVWLTFDDGPTSDTPAMLDMLDRHGAKATFFLVADRAAQQPEVVRSIIERGHDVGNHTAHHPAAWFWGLFPRAMHDQIGQAQRQLGQWMGRPPRWFRAVAGLSNPFVEPVLRRHGLMRVSWTARGFDSIDDDDVRVLCRLCRGIAPGAIVLLHEDRARPGRCVRLLDALLNELASRGYSTVLPGSLPGDDGNAATTSQLLNGVRPHSGAQSTISSPSELNSA